MNRAIEAQLDKTKKSLRPRSTILDGMQEMLKLLQIFYDYFERKMDKQIKKVKKDVEKGDKPKAKKDIEKLLKMDKKFDKKLEECAKAKKKK